MRSWRPVLLPERDGQDAGWLVQASDHVESDRGPGMLPNPEKGLSAQQSKEENGLAHVVQEIDNLRVPASGAL